MIFFSHERMRFNEARLLLMPSRLPFHSGYTGHSCRPLPPRLPAPLDVEAEAPALPIRRRLQPLDVSMPSLYW